jgi:hypothetical protein
MLRTTNAAGRIRDESLMNLGGRGLYISYLQVLLSIKHNMNRNFPVSLNLNHPIVNGIITIVVMNELSQSNE